ncbi:hypothetical protein PINS_up000846 [Pythium insidiosum]|nr:hypothetical protein PINS_up000846 [Pythium insidiosum]
MTITSKVQQQFFMPSRSGSAEQLIRLPPTVMKSYETKGVLQSPAQEQDNTPRRLRTNLWTSEEHDRFLQGLEQFPNGPWKAIAAIVGTKTTRQTMTHAQKYRQKIHRRRRREQVTAVNPTSPASAAVVAVALAEAKVLRTDAVEAEARSPQEGASSTSSPSTLDDSPLLFTDDGDVLPSALLRDTQSFLFSCEEPLVWA